MIRILLKNYLTCLIYRFFLIITAEPFSFQIIYCFFNQLCNGVSLLRFTLKYPPSFFHITYYNY